MEFDIGTLIYIIVTIVAIIASVAGKKKQPQKSSGEGDGEGKPGFFERLENQFSDLVDEAGGVFDSNQNSKAEEAYESYAGEEYAPTEHEQTFQEEIEARRLERKFAGYEGLYDPERQKEADLISSGAMESAESDEIIDVIELEKGDNPDYFEIVKDFDLSTAVIYSTIINRKEY